MKQLIRADFIRRIKSVVWILAGLFIFICNIWDLLLTDYDFEIGWSFFLFQKTPFILIIAAINTSLQISRDTCGKIANNKIILGYSPQNIFHGYICVGLMEVIILFLLDTLSITVFSLYRGFLFDIDVFQFIIYFFISLASIAVTSVLLTTLATIIPKRLLSLVIVVALSLVLFQKGEEKTLGLIEPEKTIFFNETINDEAIDNPLYVGGTKRNLYRLELLLSPYAQIQYEKYILFEDLDSKSYHLEFIVVGLLETSILYPIGRRHFIHKYD